MFLRNNSIRFFKYERGIIYIQKMHQTLTKYLMFHETVLMFDQLFICPGYVKIVLASEHSFPVILFE